MKQQTSLLLGIIFEQIHDSASSVLLFCSDPAGRNKGPLSGFTVEGLICLARSSLLPNPLRFAQAENRYSKREENVAVMGKESAALAVQRAYKDAVL